MMSTSSLKTKTVEFSNGLVLTLSQSNWRMARRKDRLEEEMKVLATSMHEDDQNFVILFYPVLAAGVVSNNCPTVEECLENFPTSDLDKWYEIARELNPDWFIILDRIAEMARADFELQAVTGEAALLEAKKEEKPQSMNESEQSQIEYLTSS